MVSSTAVTSSSSSGDPVTHVPPVDATPAGGPPGSRARPGDHLLGEALDAAVGDAAGHGHAGSDVNL